MLSLTISNTKPADAGPYDCTVTATCSSQSAAAALSVLYTCCDADFNHSGAITVQDIFDFLAAFFAGCA